MDIFLVNINLKVNKINVKMKEAIGKSIYYSAVVPQHYSNPVAIFEYSDKENLFEILKSFSKNIDVITLFAEKNHPSYSIFPYLYYIYEDIMLDKISCLYLVNRQDFCIKLVRKVDKNDENDRIAILKIDSVLSEIKQSNWSYYSLWFLIGGIVGISGGIIGLDFFKND